MSLAKQLILLQACVVVTAVAIEALAGVYHGPRQYPPALVLVTLTEVALLVGIAGSLFLAARVRRQTFNMEPAEIARRYQHHDAMLHAVREGVIITDPAGRVVLVNNEARTLLRLPVGVEGTRLPAWADGEPVRDQLQYVPGHKLMISRSRAQVDGVPVGTITTLRDRTELQQALDELGAIRELTDELRKQAHEFTNHLQTVVCMIDDGDYDQAKDLCTRRARTQQQLSGQLIDQVADPVLAGLLLARLARAARLGVTLRLPRLPAGRVGVPPEELTTIVSNLLDNGIEAAGPGGFVDLAVRTGAGGAVAITVRDSGPGIPPEHKADLFTPGWSTKPGRGPRAHGYGLAAARDAATRLGGTITVADGNARGALFHVYLPGPP